MREGVWLCEHKSFMTSYPRASVNKCTNATLCYADVSLVFALACEAWLVRQCKHSTLKHVTDCACDVTVALWACPSQRLMLKPAACWQSQHCQACLLEDMAYKLWAPKHQGCCSVLWYHAWSGEVHCCCCPV